MADAKSKIVPSGAGMSAPLRGMNTLSSLRMLGIMVGLAASVAIGVAVVLWAWTPTYSILYGDLAEKDASQVMDSLQQMGINYKVDTASGAVMVPAKDLHQARMKLASAGLPKGTGVGFEGIAGEQGFGTSQFMETARYYRAIEVELARSIMTLNNVENARVHLAIPKQSVFLRNQNKPSASVLINLYPGRNLEDPQVDAIAHMIAASVPNLEPARVTVIDQKGRLLSGKQHDAEMALSKGQFEYTQALEKNFAQRIANILTPIVGEDGVRAQVVADIDFTVTEQTQELYNADSPALRSEQTIIEQAGGAGGVGGVPGALSNQPPGAATVPETQAVQGGAAQASADSGRTNKRSTQNYELDKTISHTRSAPGRLQRVSVAVVIDDRLTEAGKRRAHTPEEIERLTLLVKEAVGFDAQRGDSVSIINTSFKMQEQAEPLPEPGIMEQPWFWDAVKMALGGAAVVLLILGVLKPLMRNLAEKAPAVPAGGIAYVTAGGEQIALPGEMEARRLGSPTKSYEQQVDEVRTMVNNEPQLVANIVKQWVAAED